eukprot:NODE_856_length_3517_cov_0.698947.p1 type:complete len:318 gc:universal NODE_856_length_3517_cov_0.698947:3184-2231(-)
MSQERGGVKMIFIWIVLSQILHFKIKEINPNENGISTLQVTTITKITDKVVKQICSPKKDTINNDEFQLLNSLNHPNIINVTNLKVIDHSNYLKKKQLQEYLTNHENVDRSVNIYTCKSFEMPYYPVDLTHNIMELADKYNDANNDSFIFEFLNTMKMVAKDVLLAVKYMHNRGISHRDIKPENIVVTDRFILIDFETATRNPFGDSITSVGSDYYLPPELLKCVDSPDKCVYNTRKMDIYNIGAILGSLFLDVHLPDDVELNDFNAGLIYFQPTHYLKQDAQFMQFYSFVRLLCHPIPDKRPTASKALKHSFLQSK